KNFSIPDLSGWSHFIQASLLVALMLTAWTTTATSHGAVENPASRTTVCRFDADARSNPMCDQAWATEPQALWDWMEVNLGAVAGAHQEQIPDGTLCGAGRDKYRAFNIPGQWPATVMQPDEDGLYPVTFHATAPHEARYFRFYLTREGFDPTQDRLQWSDLERVYDSGRVYVEELIANPHYTFRMPLPERHGRAILYLVWQRSDSPEAFYGCSDVILGESTDPQPPTPVTPPIEEETIEDNPSIPAPGMDALSVSVDLYDDWGSGACGEGVVTNSGSSSSIWEVNVDLIGSVTNYWNSEMRYSTHPNCEGSEMPHSWRVVGAPWNRTLEPGASTTFGFCIDRTQEPEMPPSDDPTMPIDEPYPHPVVDGDFVDLATLGLSHGSDHTGHDGLVGGRTAITTEAVLAYNNLREFVGLPPATIDEVGEWAFANTLTNNTQAWGNDQQGVGIWYSMQGAKVGWMADDKFDPQIVADIERTARLGSAEDVMAMVAEYGHEGFAEYLAENDFEDAFINTLKMEPHYAGWMHDRAHGWLSIEGVAIAHDVNHLTVLSHDQMQPFMNDTWDWPQWPALDVSHARVLEYFQSMVVLGDPLGDHLNDLSAPPIQDDPVTPPDVTSPEVPPANEPESPDVPEEPGPPTPEASSISVEVGGERWWNGFTAQLIVRNETGVYLDSWSFRFISSHRITGNPWGAALETIDLGNGFYEYRLSGIDWNQSIAADGSVTFGFNASQGEVIGNSGPLDAEQLFDGGFVGD
ncbi:MAG: lytic polysaccharide monooxygenase, partial [Myxococcota bacterium]